MFPAPVILLTLLTMDVIRRAELAQRVTTAASTAFNVIMLRTRKDMYKFVI